MLKRRKKDNLQRSTICRYTELFKQSLTTSKIHQLILPSITRKRALKEKAKRRKAKAKDLDLLDFSRKIC